VRGTTASPSAALPGLADEGHATRKLRDHSNGQIVAGAGLYDEYLMLYNLDLNKR